MDDIAVLNGVVSYLRSRIERWDENNCKAMPDGQPDPVMGDFFCAVHISEVQGVTNSRHGGMLSEIWGFNVTVTKRIKAIPRNDINDQVYLKQLSGISSVMSLIKYTLTNRWSLITEINSNIDYETDTELAAQVSDAYFNSTAMIMSRSPTLEWRESDWFHGTSSASMQYDPQDEGYVGVSMTLRFGDMELQIIQTDDTCE